MKRRKAKTDRARNVQLVVRSDKYTTGRPTLYRDEYVEQAKKLGNLGATDKELADFFNITLGTLHNWKVAHPEFLSSIRAGKAALDERVEDSLYHKAMGYTYDAVKIFNNDGEIIEHAYREHIPPSDTAMIFWLKNRRPERWRDKSDHDHSHTHDLKMQGESVSIADAQAMFRQTRNTSVADLERNMKTIEHKKNEDA